MTLEKDEARKWLWICNRKWIYENKMKKDKYQIRFFTVGKESKGGDAILIEIFDDNDKPHIVIIDGGYSEDGQRIVDYLVGKYGKEDKITVDVVFNTHPDLDHISGLKTILESDLLNVEYLIFNRPWRDASLKKEWFTDGRITQDSLVNRIRESFSMADDLESIAKKKGIKIYSGKAGFTVWKSTIQVLGPSDKLYQKKLLISDKTPDCFLSQYNKPYKHIILPEEDYNPRNGEAIEWIDDEQTSDINQTSMIIALVLGDLKVLFTGDAGKEAINEALDLWETAGHKATDFTIVQLPHHGSRKNIDPAIIKRLNAKEYIISCPKDGISEGHPSRRLINKILEINSNAKIYKTAGHNFVFYKGIEIKCSPQAPAVIFNKMDGKIK